MENNAASDIILGSLAVVLACTVVLLPLVALVWWLCENKDTSAHENLQREQQNAREEARARLKQKGIVSEHKWC